MEPVYVLIAAAAAWLFLGGEPTETPNLEGEAPEQLEDRYADL